MSRGAGRAPAARALFVSDLHLSAGQPARTRAFVAFLGERARGATDLYLLGDLFDLWIGDTTEPLAQTVCAALAGLSTSGTRVWLMPGNRDYLIDTAFAARAGATLLCDPARIDLDGTTVVLTHGDLLCTADRGYQRLRRVLRSAPARWLLRAAPLALRRRVAAGLRAASRRSLARKEPHLTEAQPEACEALLRAERAAWLIHGHTHRPGRHAHAAGTRLVLGAWDDGPWVLEWPGLSPFAPPGAAETPPYPHAIPH
jgi:UDP-2,3-diacylglucosamine hydrolase